MATTNRRPTLWIVAGPNGSGKSTLYDTTLIEDFGRSVWIINPDLLTQKIIDQEGLARADANLSSVKRIMIWLKASLCAHQTVGVETVLSTPKYRSLVDKAKARGFEVRLIYVMLRKPELNVERVRLRVARGGHAVPAEKIVDRYKRSLEQLPWFLEAADRAFLFDNSGAEPRMVALKDSEGNIVLDPDAPEPLRRVILSMESE
jgi:predicted ABC-type ATPase